jgi:hypothetical protein
MNNPKSVTKDGMDISESSDIKLIYPKKLISQNEYEKLIKVLGKDFLTFYRIDQSLPVKQFAGDVGIYYPNNIADTISVENLYFLEEDSERFNKNKELLFSRNLIYEYSIFYENLCNKPLDYLNAILIKLNLNCKECKFSRSFFEIDEYTKNSVKVKLQKMGFRRMFSIDYIFSENEKLIFNISLTVNNLENKVKYWLRFYDSDKHYSVILSCQISETRNEFIDKYPYLTFILDLIHQ